MGRYCACWRIGELEKWISTNKTSKTSFRSLNEMEIFEKEKAKIKNMNEMDVEIATDNKEKKLYGFYSAKAEKLGGYYIYLNSEGKKVKVTCVDENSEEVPKSYIWDDTIKIGLLSKWVSYNPSETMIEEAVYSEVDPSCKSAEFKKQGLFSICEAVTLLSQGGYPVGNQIMNNLVHAFDAVLADLILNK